MNLMNKTKADLIAYADLMNDMATAAQEETKEVEREKQKVVDKLNALTYEQGKLIRTLEMLTVAHDKIIAELLRIRK